MTVPAGRWRIRTASDDGIRVWIDDNLVIDDWTWHSLKMHTHELELTESKQITIRVEHF
ncbi:MAG: PA14 domain-containing protein, partial [Planctomycetota bacterium]